MTGSTNRLAHGSGQGRASIGRQAIDVPETGVLAI